MAVNSEQQKQRPIENRTDPSPAAINHISGGGRTEPERAVEVPGKPQTLPSETKADLWEKAELGKIQERYSVLLHCESYLNEQYPLPKLEKISDTRRWTKEFVTGKARRRTKPCANLKHHRFMNQFICV